MSKKNIKQTINEKQINFLAKKSLKEVENFSEIETVKKKYLEKGKVIFQFFQQISQEKESIKKKSGNLINHWKNELTVKVKEINNKTISRYGRMSDYYWFTKGVRE